MTQALEIEFGLPRLDEAEAQADLAGLTWRRHYPGILSAEQIEYRLAQRYKPGLLRQLPARGDLWLAARAGGELPGFAHGHPLAEGGKAQRLPPKICIRRITPSAHPPYSRQYRRSSSTARASVKPVACKRTSTAPCRSVRAISAPRAR